MAVDDDTSDPRREQLRFWVDTDGDGDYSDETTLISTTAVGDEWSAGYVGLYKGGSEATVHQWDDFQVGHDNNDDGDIADAGDEILVSDDFNSNQVRLSYDNNGNLTDDGVYKFEYDAWNRLRKTIHTDGSDETTIGEYEYYADNRRSKKTVSNRGEEVIENDGGNTTVLFYYDRQWRILETRNGSNQTTFQHLWGTRYTDELIWLEKNGDPTESNDTNPDDQSGESTGDQRYFAHQDRNWNVIALSEYDTAGTNNGRIVERYSYTPYGSFVVLKGDSGSGELDNISLTSTIGSPFGVAGHPADLGVPTAAAPIGVTLTLTHPIEAWRQISSPPQEEASPNHFSCNPGHTAPDGQGPRVNLGIGAEPCSAACNLVHELVHYGQFYSCCFKAWEKIQKCKELPTPVERVQCIIATKSAYDNWVNANDDCAECQAYAADIVCFGAALGAAVARADCMCMTRLALEVGVSAGMIAYHCPRCAAQGGTISECPIKDDVVPPPAEETPQGGTGGT